MERWAFNLQIYFLNSRFAQVQKIRSLTYSTVIQDRTIYEDAHIFARNLYDSKILTKRDFECYLLLFDSIINSVPPPDLMIYLKADIPKLVQQIKKRGRDFESDISTDYLKSLNTYYERFVSTYDHGKLLVIDVNEIDFANNPDDFQAIVSVLDGELYP